MNAPYISIVIPCYSMGGRGGELLDHSFNILYKQTFKDFEVVITDHSTCTQNEVEQCYESWKDRLNIQYYRNAVGIGIAPVNINMALKNCNGKLIKILCQDDFLYDEHSLQAIVDAFTDDVSWLVTSYIHTSDKVNFINKHVPTIAADIDVHNTIGTLSCMAIRNEDLIYYDENLKWAYDCEYYYRLIKKLGNPKILDVITVVNYLWAGSTTNTIANASLMQMENAYIINKRK